MELVSYVEDLSLLGVRQALEVGQLLFLGLNWASRLG